MPVRVAAGAFGDGLPARPLWLSPDHAVFIDEALIPIRYLLNGASIVQVDVPAVTYWHVELPRHAVILAEGLPAESYLDAGNRSAFANGGTAVQMHAEFARRVWDADGCAKLVREGATLQAARAATLVRAQVLGYEQTREPALRALVDGREIAAEAAGGVYRFVLPAATRGVTLHSRAAIPAQVSADNTDPRRLGVAVAGLALNGAPIALADARLGGGWHELEHTAEGAAWRWTDGAAALALAGGGVLTVSVLLTERYWLPPTGNARQPMSRRWNSSGASMAATAR